MSTDRDDRRQKRIETFRQLAAERLTRLNRVWIEAERPGADLAPFLREAHTLKGECSLTGFAGPAKVMHAVEDVAQRSRAAGRPPTAAEGDLVIAGLALAGTLIGREPHPDPAVPPVVDFLQRVRNELGLGGLGGGHTTVTVTPLAAGAPATGAEPAAPLEPAGSGAAASLPPGAPAPPSAAGRRKESSVRVAADKLDRLRDMVAEMLLSRTRLRSAALEVRKMREAARGLQTRLVRADPEAGREAALIAEILAAHETRLRDESHTLSRLATELDGSTRDLRMVPLRTLLERYPLPLRTLARSLGREVSFIAQGQEIDVDRGVLEVLEEPLLHLLRNAVDHGIEDPGVRRRQGKPALATLSLRANLAGQMLQLEVSDDGAGIDVETVRQRALDMGLLDPEAGPPSEAQVLRTVFSAGLSTRPQVTELSGRGIGLNVVLDTVESLGGDVQIRTVRGQGTTFQLRIPGTVAISSVILFRVGVGRYALLASSVRSVVDAADHPPQESPEGPAIRYAGALVPLLPLDGLLGEGRAPANAAADRRILIAQSGGDLVALQATREHLEQELLVKPPGKLFERDRLVSAVVQLGDGNLALVLKASELVLAARHRLGIPAAPEGEGAPGAVATVLVVDDSPVVRDVVGETLRSYGLHVAEASDGEEALLKLTGDSTIDLLITDLDMPRLDGLGLLRAVRARPADGRRRLPAMVISMRGGDRDRALALDAGADGYLIKSDFSPAALWDMVSTVLARSRQSTVDS
jgi:two-component system, chemotaxis family, sensor kinase CheA